VPASTDSKNKQASKWQFIQGVENIAAGRSESKLFPPESLERLSGNGILSELVWDRDFALLNF